VIETYEEAVEVVRREIAPLWGDTQGTFFVSPNGFEDETSFYVPWGAREWLVDNDPQFLLLNNAATFVDKITGFVELTTASVEMSRIEAMSPCGEAAR
jgi:hypothetical protein